MNFRLFNTLKVYYLVWLSLINTFSPKSSSLTLCWKPTFSLMILIIFPNYESLSVYLYQSMFTLYVICPYIFSWILFPLQFILTSYSPWSYICLIQEQCKLYFEYFREIFFFNIFLKTLSINIRWILQLIHEASLLMEGGRILDSWGFEMLWVGKKKFQPPRRTLNGIVNLH